MARAVGVLRSRDRLAVFRPMRQATPAVTIAVREAEGS
jgi:hypothetical protein